MGGHVVRTVRPIKAWSFDITLARVGLCSTPYGGGVFTVEEGMPDYGRCIEATV